MEIPKYPEFAPIDFSMRDSLYPALNLNKDGISEFTFAGLYLFRKTYDYKIARLGEQGLLLAGTKNGQSFFSAPCCFPDPNVFDELMRRFDFMKNMSESQAQAHRIELEGRGYIVTEDRNNFDYLYYRKDLAELSGREYHKKRNLVNGFINTYECIQRPLTKDNARDALVVLDKWREEKGSDGDYASAKEGIELFSELKLRGAVYYIEGKPVGYCMGEALAKGTMFAVHFEKAIDEYKGIYQFINQAFAQSLPAYFKVINREQDLGDEGLRQAKMTYRPFGFVKKYRVMRPDTQDFVPRQVSEPAETGPGCEHD